MYSRYNKIFWGIFFATFSINIGSLKILPSFVGFLIILNGISVLYNETQLDSFKKAKIFAAIATIMNFTGWILSLFSSDIMNSFLINIIWMVLYAVIEMLLFYKIIEGSIEYFNINGYCEIANDNVMKARFYLIFSTILIILLSINEFLSTSALSILLLIGFIILRIFLMILTRRYRNVFKSDQ